ncbi:hypothetical protein [Bacillus cereus]|uniref:Uncharacterized protein n=1 Tax=Bacillus cereus TaxID=1396 RepID=A0A9X7G9T1_BACCE|nr:hypothetical protein [Bacillus cereus]PED41978.1 hypothetical protein CON26_20970 [Bacillus cereus]PFV11205.1 hypothetical protein COK98_02725 [Bacillus cereus]
MTTNLLAAKTILLLKIRNVIASTNELLSKHKDQIKMGHLVIKNHELQCSIFNIKSRNLSRVSLKELNEIYSQAVDVRKEAQS